QRIEQILVTDGSTPGSASHGPLPFFLRFDSAEIADRSDGEPLGYLLENRHIRAALAAAVQAAGIEVLAPARVAKATFGPRAAEVTLADGRVLTAPLAETFAVGGQALVPLLTGWNADEGSTYPIFETRAQFRQVLAVVFGANANRAAALYPTPTDADAVTQSQALSRDAGFAAGIYRAAQLQAAAGQPVYLYHFERRSPFRPDQHVSDLEPASRLGAYHGAEVPYVFGTLHSLDRGFQPEDGRLSDAMQAYWVNFAVSGDPNGKGLPDWPSYHHGGQALRLGDTVRPGPVPDRDRLDFINSVTVRIPGG
ncbi:MAG: carboxylesterase family protein, partial [Phenylobacterium sp.]